MSAVLDVSVEMALIDSDHSRGYVFTSCGFDPSIVSLLPTDSLGSAVYKARYLMFASDVVFHCYVVICITSSGCFYVQFPNFALILPTC